MSDIEKLTSAVKDLTTSVAGIGDRVLHVERSIDAQNQKLEDAVATADEQALLLESARQDLGARQTSTSGPTDRFMKHSYMYGNEHPWKHVEYEAERTDDSVAEVQREFEQLKDGLVKVKLPSDLKVFHKPAGIKEDCKQAYGILKECVAFHDTAAKWLTECIAEVNETGSVTLSRADLKDLFTVQLAQANFLRSEYTGLLVKSSVDEDTSKFYKLFERNPTCFSDRAMKHLTNAAELSVIKSRAQNAAGQRRNRQGGSFNPSKYKSGGRNNYNNNYNQTFQSKNIPPKPRRASSMQTQTSEEA